MDVSAETTSSVEFVKASGNEIMGRANPARDHNVNATDTLLAASQYHVRVPSALWLLARNQERW